MVSTRRGVVRRANPPGGICQRGGILVILRGGYRPPDEIFSANKVGEKKV